MHETDILYWENSLSLARDRYDPLQREYKTTVENCFFPGIFEPGQSLQQKIARMRRGLPRIVEEAEYAIRRISDHDGYADFRRASWMGLKARALRLMGEPIPLHKELSDVYKLQVERVPDSKVKEAQQVLDSELPLVGNGSLDKRLQMYSDRFRVPELAANDTQLARDAMNGLIEVARDLTRERLPDLINEANFNLVIRPVEQYGGRYLFHNPDSSTFEAVMSNGTPESRTVVPFVNQFSIVLHELYPGHHCQVPSQFKKAQEDSLGILYGFVSFGPYVAIAEGLGNNAGRMLASDEEQAEILAPFYKRLGRDVTAEDIRLYRRLGRVRKDIAESVMDNATFDLLDEKKPKDEVVQYLQEYGLMTKDEAEGMIWFIGAVGGYAAVYRTSEKSYRDWLESQGDMSRQRAGYTYLSKNIIMPNQLSETKI